MDLLRRPLSEETLRWLIETSRPEDQRIEYKRTLPSGEQPARERFLDDVAALANARGGWVIYGMDAGGDGIPTRIRGLDSNLDEAQRRLQEIARAHTDPTVPVVEFEQVQTSDGPALVMYVRNSWLKPHMITLGSWRFLVRIGSQNVRMDVDTLKAQILGGSEIERKIGQWRHGRLARIVSHQTPYPLTDEPMLVVHGLPFGAFEESTRFGPDDFGSSIQSTIGQQFNGDHRLNLDGVARPAGVHAPYRGYIQLFRSGAIECVDCSFSDSEERFGYPVLYPVHLEGAARTCLAIILSVYRELKVEPPVAIMLTMLAVEGRSFPPDPMDRVRRVKPELFIIDRSELVLDPVLVERLDDDMNEILKTSLDSIWLAAGLRRSV